MAFHNIIGSAGEAHAREYLVNRGLIVRETNWRIGHYEIDIIAEEQDCLHIIEVKTRERKNSEDFDPMEAVDSKKQRRLIVAANAYINYWKIDYNVQYDVMIMLYDKDSEDFEIDFVENAFYPKLRTY